jgi:hypothetical protein
MLDAVAAHVDRNPLKFRRAQFIGVRLDFARATRCCEIAYFFAYNDCR